MRWYPVDARRRVLVRRADFVLELVSKHIESTPATAPTQQLLEDRRTRSPVPEQARDPTQARTTGSSSRRLRFDFADNEPLIFTTSPTQPLATSKKAHQGSAFGALLGAGAGSRRIDGVSTAPYPPT